MSIDRVQHFIVKILDTQTETIETTVEEVLPILHFEISRVTLNGNFRLVDGVEGRK